MSPNKQKNKDLEVVSEESDGEKTAKELLGKIDKVKAFCKMVIYRRRFVAKRKAAQLL